VAVNDLRKAIKAFDLQQCYSLVEEFSPYDAARLIVIGAETSQHQPSLDRIQAFVERNQEDDDE
jgi:hypothetical protein